jgi:hypothetical protein
MEDDMLNTVKRLALVLSFLVVVSLAACSPQPAVVFTTQVDADGRPLNSATLFSVDTPRIICSVSTAGLPATGEISAAWLYNLGGQWKPLKEESLAVASGPYLVFPASAPVTGWVTGEYSVDLLLNGKKMSSAGFSVQAAQGVPLPDIRNFSAVPETITAGQSLTLSWNVQDASSIDIKPGIGSVQAGGSRLVSPVTNTTYTLNALNSGGPSSKSISVTVLPFETRRANLAMVNIFREAPMVYYTVRNVGDAVSNPSSAELYVNNSVASTGYVPPMAPGETRTLQFGSFAWSYLYDTAATVCVDTKSENGPAGSTDSCMTRILPGARAF